MAANASLIVRDHALLRRLLARSPNVVRVGPTPAEHLRRDHRRNRSLSEPDPHVPR